MIETAELFDENTNVRGVLIDCVKERHSRYHICDRASARTYERRSFMWNLFNCYLSGRHDYGMWCEPGAIFLRCIHCGKRSSGWAVVPKPLPISTVGALRPGPPPKNSCVLPFDSAAGAVTRS
jgi:hypothetical protein